MDSTELKQYIQHLWRELSGNYANRALVVARLVANRADPQLKQHVAGLIKASLPDCPERREALNLLFDTPAQKPKLFSHLQIVREGHNGTTLVTPIFADPDALIAVRADPELARIAVALWLASFFRLWVIAREETRTHTGSGTVEKKTLFEKLPTYGIEITRDHFNRMLRLGNGIFWNRDRDKRRLFIRSTSFVAQKLVTQACEVNPLLVASNRPGVREVYLFPAGSHEQWEAIIYAGWMTHREAPTIARSTLEMLFNRDQDTLRRWEQTRLTDTLTIRTNYAQHHAEADQWSDWIPDHARNYLANVAHRSGTRQEIRVYWRLPNTYIPHSIRQHPRRGQAGKVRTHVNATLGEPAYIRRGGLHTSKLYFDKAQRLRRQLKKQGGFGYLWRGENRHGHGIFEPTDTGFGETRPTERAKYKQEYRFFKCLEILRKEYAIKSNE